MKDYLLYVITVLMIFGCIFLFIPYCATFWGAVQFFSTIIFFDITTLLINEFLIDYKENKKQKETKKQN